MIGSACCAYSTSARRLDVIRGGSEIRPVDPVGWVGAQRYHLVDIVQNRCRGDDFPLVQHTFRRSQTSRWVSHTLPTHSHQTQMTDDDAREIRA
jgi:hypothetical protein